MSVDKLYTLAQCVLDGANIDGMAELGVEHGLGLIVEGSDGSPQANYAAIASVGSIITGTSSKLAALLAKVGAGETKLYAGHTAAFYYQQVAAGARRTAGSTHLKKTIAAGIAIPREISAEQGGNARMSFDAIAVYDGTNEPIVVADTQALPGTPDLNLLHTVGKVTLNGTQLSGIQSIRVVFGVTVYIVSGDGDPRPTFVAVKSLRRQIRVVTTDLSYCATLQQGIKRSAATVVYLQKRDQGGKLVAAATAEHISFTINEGMILPGRSGVTQEGNATKEVILQPTFDGTNEQLVIDTACAIA